MDKDEVIENLSASIAEYEKKFGEFEQWKDKMESENAQLRDIISKNYKSMEDMESEFVEITSQIDSDEKAREEMKNELCKFQEERISIESERNDLLAQLLNAEERIVEVMIDGIEEQHLNEREKISCEERSILQSPDCELDRQHMRNTTTLTLLMEEERYLSLQERKMNEFHHSIVEICSKSNILCHMMGVCEEEKKSTLKMYNKIAESGALGKEQIEECMKIIREAFTNVYNVKSGLECDLQKERMENVRLRKKIDIMQVSYNQKLQIKDELCQSLRSSLVSLYDTRSKIKNTKARENSTKSPVESNEDLKRRITALASIIVNGMENEE